MHTVDYVALSLFLAAHIGTTILIGRWLNKMARKEVANAVSSVAGGLIQELGKAFPILGTFARTHAHQGDGQRVSADADKF